MEKNIKLLRGYFNDFNYKLQQEQNKSKNAKGFTTKELMAIFKNEKYVKYIPLIVEEYLEYGCSKNIDGHIFVYWDHRSASTRARHFNGFDDDSKFVCEVECKELSYVFSPKFYIKSPHWKDMAITLTYAENHPLYNYVLKTFGEKETTKTNSLV